VAASGSNNTKDKFYLGKFFWMRTRICDFPSAATLLQSGQAAAAILLQLGIFVAKKSTQKWLTIKKSTGRNFLPSR
jgi:hypothetical protein